MGLSSIFAPENPLSAAMSKRIASCLCISCATTVALVIAQYWLTATDSGQLGNTQDEIAREILRSYLGPALSEASKLIGLAFAAIFALSMVATQFRGSGHRVGAAIAITVAVMLFELGAVLQMPTTALTLLESLGLQKPLYYLAHSGISPKSIYLAAGMLLTLVLVAALLQMPKRVYLGLVATCFIVGGAILVSQRPDSKAPIPYESIYIIGIDSLRSDAINARITPSLSELALDPQTVAFEDHIVGIPRTFPSWIEILSGLYSPVTGYRHMFPPLSKQRAPLNSIIRQVNKYGYRSIVHSDFAGDIFPRVNLGLHETHTPNFDLNTLIRVTVLERLALFLPLTQLPFFSSLFPATDENPSLTDPHRLALRAQTSITEARRRHLLILFFSTAHFPYASHWPWYKKFSDPHYTGPYLFKKEPRISLLEKVSAEDVAQIRSLYKGALAAIDNALGQFFSFLKKKDLWNSATIVVTADHGEDLFEFAGIQGHGDHLAGENVLRVPLFIKLPSRLTPKRRRLAFTTRAVDIAPTLRGILDKAPVKSSGLNLLPWILDASSKDPSLYAYSETGIWFGSNKAFYQKQRIKYPGIGRLLNVDPGGTGLVVLDRRFAKTVAIAKHRSLSSGKYKLIVTTSHKGTNFALFDRKADPYCLVDIAKQEKKIFDRYKRHMLGLLDEIDSENLNLLERF